MLGLGTLLPWNFFMTATMVWHHFLSDSLLQAMSFDLTLIDGLLPLLSLQYFTSRLKNATHLEEPTNWTAAGAEHRSVLEAKFNSVMTLCAMLPLLVFTCLNSFLLSLWVAQRPLPGPFPPPPPLPHLNLSVLWTSSDTVGFYIFSVCVCVW